MSLLRVSQFSGNISSGTGSSVNLTTYNSFSSSYSTGSFLGSFFGALTGSSLYVSGPVIINAISSSNNIFLIQSGSIQYLKINNQGILVLNPSSNSPSPVSGGVWFDNSGNVFVGL